MKLLKRLYGLDDVHRFQHVIRLKFLSWLKRIRLDDVPFIIVWYQTMIDKNGWKSFVKAHELLERGNFRLNSIESMRKLLKFIISWNSSETESIVALLHPWWLNGSQFRNCSFSCWLTFSKYFQWKCFTITSSINEFFYSKIHSKWMSRKPKLSSVKTMHWG